MSHRWTVVEYFMLRAELDQHEITCLTLYHFIHEITSLKEALHACEVVTLLADTFSAIIQQAVWMIPVMGVNHKNGVMSIAKPQHKDIDCILAHLYPNWRIHIIWHAVRLKWLLVRCLSYS